MEPLEPRRLLAAVAWDGGPSKTGTDLLDPINWAGDVLPGPADDATISVTGAPTLTLAGNLSVRSLVASEKLKLNSGTLSVATTGQLQTGGSITLDGGTLRGGQWQAGSLTLIATTNPANRLQDARYPAASFTGGVLSIGGSTTFSSIIGKNNFTLCVDPGMTITYPITSQTGGMSIQMSASGSLKLASSGIAVASGSKLSIGATSIFGAQMSLDFSSPVTFTQQNSLLEIAADSFINRTDFSIPSVGTLSILSNSVDNRAAIRADAGGLAIGGGAWINHGVLAGSTRYLTIPTTSFENLGTIEVGSGPVSITGLVGDAGTILLPSGKWSLSLQGSFVLSQPIAIGLFGALTLDGDYIVTTPLSIAAGGTLGLNGKPTLEKPVDVAGVLTIGGSLTLSDLDQVHNFGIVALAGELDLQGGTLDVGARGGFWRYGGVIRRGAILTRGEITADSAHLTLDNVDVHGSLVAYVDVSLRGTTRVDSITLHFANLGLGAGMTLHGRVTFAAGSDTYWPYVEIGTDLPGSFTIGDDCVITVESGFQGHAVFGWLFNNRTTAVTNLGTILVQGGSLSAGPLFDNQGTILVTGGASLGATLTGNSGRISAEGEGSSFAVSPATGATVINRGSLLVGTGSSGTLGGLLVNEGELAFDGNLRLSAFNSSGPELGEYTRGPNGFMTLVGLWELGGGTLIANAHTGSIQVDATISNGILEVADGAHFIPLSAHFSSTDVRDDLVMSASGSLVQVSGSTRFHSLHMRGGLEFRMLAPYTLRDDVYFERTALNAAPAYRVILNGYDKQLTIAETSHIIGDSAYAGSVEMRGAYTNEGTLFFNQGVIRMEGAGSSLLLWPRELTNEGVIEGLGGAFLTVRALNWRGNTGWIRSTGGTLTLMGSATTAALGFDHISVTGGVGELSLTIANAGATLVFDAPKSTWQTRSAVITGGVVEIADGTTLRVGKENGYVSWVSLALNSVEVRGDIVVESDYSDLQFGGTTSARLVRLAGKGTSLIIPAGTLSTSVLAEAGGSSRSISVSTSSSNRALSIPDGIFIELSADAVFDIASTSYAVDLTNHGTIRVGDGSLLNLGNKQTLTNAGLIEVGASGSIKIPGAFIQTPSGTLWIAWGGGEFPPAVLQGGSTMTLGGTISVEFDAENPPIAPDHFVVAKGTTVDSSGATISIPAAPQYRKVKLVQGTSELAVELTSVGDIDGNGFVDLDDYVSFTQRYTSGDPSADFDGDGDVDQADLALFLYVFDLG